MAREEEIKEGPGSGGDQSVGPGDVSGGPAPVDPVPMSCEDYDNLIAYYQRKIDEANNDLADLKFYQVKKKNTIKARIGAFNELIRDAKDAKKDRGCP